MKNSPSLFAGVLLFVVLDLSILGINYWIAHQISKDAVAINLAGRQRMLSQRITKSLFAMDLEKSAESRADSMEEFRESAKMFDQTLLAFEYGGNAVGGGGEMVKLSRVTNTATLADIKQAQEIWAPVRKQLLPYFDSKTSIPETVLAYAKSEMLNHNLELLRLMNRLASATERDSRNQASVLRIVQTVVFLLALLNFIVIVRQFHLLAHHAHQAKEHFSLLAFKDTLTGLSNRRHLEDKLERELSSTHEGTKHKLTLMMLDLDGFKAINDEFGHEAGDAVLKAIGMRLQQLSHKDDTVTRLGGDEFVLTSNYLRNRNVTSRFCDQIVQAINLPIRITVAHKVHQVHVGASIGVVFHPGRNKTKSDILHMADQAMYVAKKSGKNQFVFA